jgi:hypothetical protein
MLPRKWPFLVATVAILALAPARACNVPVFRYALERWRPDAYEAILFHKGPLTPELEKLVAELRKAGDDAKEPANLEVLTVDLAGEVPENARKLWEAQANGATPWLVIRYPASVGIDASVWSGPPSAEIVKTLLRSPARREIARRLMKGDSVVWVIIDTGDKKHDDATAELVQTELKKLEKSLKLPNPDAPDEDGKVVKLLAELPLKMSFSVLRVSRDDPKEELFVAMLLNADTDGPKLKGLPVTMPVFGRGRPEEGWLTLAAARRSLMFPIFGRGRALDAFAGSGINAENIESVASFLAGPCSCTVKRLSPGADVLMAANWESVVEGGASAPAESPNKPGVPVPIPTGVRATEKATEQSGPTVRAAPAADVDNPKRSGVPMYIWIGAVALTLLVVSAALRSRKPNGESTP